MIIIFLSLKAVPLKKLGGNQHLSHPTSLSMASSCPKAPKGMEGDLSCQDAPEQSRLQHPHHQILPLFASPEPISPSPPARLAQMPCLHRSKGYCWLGLGWDRAFGGPQRGLAKANSPERCCSPGCLEAHLKAASHTPPPLPSFSLACQLRESNVSE